MGHYLGIELKLADFEITHWLLWQNEWWNPVVEWEESYEVSTLGRVRSFDRVTIRKDGKKMTFKGCLLKPGTYPNGYKYVGFSRGVYQKNEMIHKLVMYTFIGKSDKIGNHKNFNKSDNRLLNMDFCSHRENSHHYFKSKSHTSQYTGICKTQKGWFANIAHLGKQWQICCRQTEKEAYYIYKEVYDKILEAKTHEEIKNIIKSARANSPSPSRRGCKYNIRK